MCLQKKTTFVFILCVAAIIWLAGYLCFSISAISPKPLNKNTQSDAIVVLTGGNYRIQTGIDALLSGKAPQLFISGVHKSVSKQEIVEVWEGVNDLASCCVTIGHEATTTFENAIEVKSWLKNKNYRSIYLITSTYHMNRALMELRYALPDIEIIRYEVPYEDYKPTELAFWVITFSEYHKWLLRFSSLTLFGTTENTYD